jgi:glycosyltransferase involved in cell wall biosynthesis
MRIAVMVPCHNEEVTIGQVISDFRSSLPAAQIYVYDNNSTDRTAAIALEAGAIVRTEYLQGKGHVVRRMFADIEADIYVMADGDATYDAGSAPKLIKKLTEENLDMVVASRLYTDERDAFPKGHHFGNRVLTGLVSVLFGSALRDMLSGYRVFSRRFVKSFPAVARGYETETELTVHCLTVRLPMAEVETPYFRRPEGSSSKLNKYQDGVRILLTALRLLKAERPVLFFTTISFVLAVTALLLAIPILFAYVETGLVPRLPTALLSASLMILAFLSLTSGVILANVTEGRREQKRLLYLQIPRGDLLV